MKLATILALGLGLVTMVGCNKADDSPKATTTTTSGSKVKTLSAAECEKQDKKNDPQCDWYYDPMRQSEQGDTAKK